MLWVSHQQLLRRKLVVFYSFIISKSEICFILIAVLVTTSCSYEDNDTTKRNESFLKTEIEKDDTLYSDNHTLIIVSENSVDTLLKFNSRINDSLFYVQPIEIKLIKKIDFSEYEYKKMFVTRIKDGVAEKGANFAGHFCFVFWGCGSPCKLSAIVDLRSGKVYNGLPSEIGYEFRKNSKLLIVNPPDPSNWFNKNVLWHQPSQYIWTGKKFVKL